MKNTNKISSDRQRVFYILCILFYIYPLSAQKISVQNKSNTSSLNIITDSQKITIKENEKKDFTNLKTLLLSNESGLTQTLYLFLDTKETLNIQISDTKINYTGNKDSLQSYIEMLNAVTFGELKNYYKYYYQEKNPKKYITSSEILYADISKKVNALNTPLPSEETTQRLKTYIKYNWLSTVFLGFQGKNIDNFQKEIVPYYYNKYISSDIPQFQCETVYQYDILKYLAKYKKELGIQLPVYEIVATDENDYINQHLPKSCQRYYFQNNYKYLNHINDPKKEHYKNILMNQFKINTF